jgi:hypothetical protein
MDFAIKVAGVDPGLVFVECDGKEFHSSPAQIARDRLKDKLARDAGIALRRFTGSEINKRGDACAYFIVDDVWALLPRGAT